MSTHQSQPPSSQNQANDLKTNGGAPSGSGLSEASAREIGRELARLYREANASVPTDRPKLESFARAEKIIHTCALEERRPSGGPAPTLEELRAIAVAIGHSRVAKDIFGIESQIAPVFTTGAQCVETLKALGQIGMYRDAIEFLRSAKVVLDISVRHYQSGGGEIGFFVRSNGEVPLPHIENWEKGIDRAFESFEQRARYSSDAELRLVAIAIDKLRNFHSALRTLEDITSRHAVTPAASTPDSLELKEAASLLGKAELDIVIPRILSHGMGRTSAYTALIFAEREPQIRHLLAHIEGEPLQRFITGLIESSIHEEHPRVARELSRLNELVKARSEVASETRLPGGVPPTSPELVARANLAAKLAFLRESRGERFEATLDEISRKVGPVAAIERFNALARCCRTRKGGDFAAELVSAEPKILTLTAPRFQRYVEALREAIATIPPPTVAQLLPDAVGSIRSARAEEKVTPAPLKEDPRETEIIRQLDESGINGDLALTVLKHGFHHRGALFTGHRTISRQGVLGLAESKLNASRPEIEECLDGLVRRGAVVEHGRQRRGLALNRVSEITEPALNAAVSYVESFWAEHRNK